MKINRKKILLGFFCIAILAAITYAIVRGQSQVQDTFTDETKIASKTNITITGGQIRLFNCGDNVTFTYKSSQVTFGTVTSTNSVCWLDRNLGANQIATKATDTAAYGDYFQWGREDDGHQASTSATVEGDMTLTAQPGHSNFIKEQTSPYDWATTTWTTRWTVAASDPCPAGWRVPTNAEWSSEEATFSPQSLVGAYASPLKLTAGGYRSRTNGSLLDVGTYGHYWSSVVSGTSAWDLSFYSSDSYMGSSYRAYGFSVRCLKD
ncbi:MAG: FISUMP domain-containing protein [bacterium]|nr:FISUMP domain-containing protein [bacterium]